MMRNKELISEIKRLQEIMGVEKSKPLLFEQPIVAKLLGLIPSKATKLFPKLLDTYPELVKPLSALTDKTLDIAQKSKSADEVYRIATSKGISVITSEFDKMILDEVTSTITKSKKWFELALEKGKTKDEIYESIYGKTTGSVGDLEKAFKKSFFESLDEISEKMVKSSPSPKVSPKVSPKPRKTSYISDEDVAKKMERSNPNPSKVTPESTEDLLKGMDEFVEDLKDPLSSDIIKATEKFKSEAVLKDASILKQIKFKLNYGTKKLKRIGDDITTLSESLDNSTLKPSEQMELIGRIGQDLSRIANMNDKFGYDLMSGLTKVIDKYPKGDIKKEFEKILKYLKERTDVGNQSGALKIIENLSPEDTSKYLTAFQTFWKEKRPILGNTLKALEKGDRLTHLKKATTAVITGSSRGLPPLLRSAESLKKYNGPYKRALIKGGKSRAALSYLSEAFFRYTYSVISLAALEVFLDLYKSIYSITPEEKKKLRDCVSNSEGSNYECESIIGRHPFLLDFIKVTNESPDNLVGNIWKMFVINIKEKIPGLTNEWSSYYTVVPGFLPEIIDFVYHWLGVGASDKESSVTRKKVDTMMSDIKDEVEEKVKETEEKLKKELSPTERRYEEIRNIKPRKGEI